MNTIPTTIESSPPARQALTDRAARALKPRDTVYEVPDGTIPGLKLRVMPTGEKRWSLRYRVGRGERRIALGTFPKPVGLKAARDLAGEKLLQVKKGGDPSLERRQLREDTTVRELLKLWEKGHSAKLVTGAEMVRVLQNEIPRGWWSRPARSIVTSEVSALLDTIVPDRPYQANKVRAYLSSMFSYGVPRGLVEVHPVRDTELPTTPQEREGTPLTPKQIRRLWAVLTRQHPIIAAYYRVRLLTLQRGKQVRLMKWADVEFTDDGSVGEWWAAPASTTKTRRPNRVYLSPLAGRELERLRPLTGDGEYVFASPRKEGSPLGRLQKSSQRIRDAAGLPHEWAREFRRTGRTWLASTGKVSPDACERILGHSLKGVRGAYDQYDYGAEKRKALTLWSGHVLEALLRRRPEPAKVVEFGSRA